MKGSKIWIGLVARFRLMYQTDSGVRKIVQTDCNTHRNPLPQVCTCRKNVQRCVQGPANVPAIRNFMQRYINGNSVSV